MKIAISTLFDCVIDCKGQKYEFAKNTSALELDLENNEEVFLLFYPTTCEKLIPYAKLLKNKNNKLFFDASHTSFWQDNLGNYQLNFLPFKLCEFSLKRIYKNVKNGHSTFVVLADKNFVCFDDGNNIFCETFDGELENYDFLTIFSNPSVSVKTDIAEHLFVFNSSKSKVEKFFGQVEMDGDTLCLTQEKNDFAKHAKRKEYKFENGEFVLVRNDLLYAASAPQTTKNPKIVPLAFFEAVHEKNFFLAKQYLTHNLKQQVSGEILQEYFGDFDNVKQYDFAGEQGCFVSLVKGEKSKIFCLKMQGDKIDEIEFYNINNKLT